MCLGEVFTEVELECLGWLYWEQAGETMLSGIATARLLGRYVCAWKQHIEVFKCLLHEQRRYRGQLRRGPSLGGLQVHTGVHMEVVGETGSSLVASGRMLEARNGRLGRANQPLNCRPDNSVCWTGSAFEVAARR